uniref:hypothetical protein n=1 Tax=Nocardia suismassiliense TaxID=2077092 RepID=UPI003F495FFC
MLIDGIPPASRMIVIPRPRRPDTAASSLDISAAIFRQAIAADHGPNSTAGLPTASSVASPDPTPAASAHQPQLLIHEMLRRPVEFARFTSV